MRALRSFIACVGLLLCIIAAQPAPRADFSGGCPSQAAQFFARAPGASANRQNYCNLIAGLVNAGIWQQLDVLYVFAAPTQSVALTNLVSSSFGATAVNSPTFTAYRGIAGDGSTSYVNSNFTPSTAGGKYKLNSGHLSVWNTTSISVVTATVSLIAGIDGVNDTEIAFATPSIEGVFLNSTNNFTAFSTSNLQGWWAANRAASTSSQNYKNGSNVGNDATASTNLVSRPIYIGARNVSGSAGDFFSGQIAMADIGASVAANQVAAYYAALQTYLHAVGAV